MNQLKYLFFLVLIIHSCSTGVEKDSVDGPYQATGIKICEVDDHSAIIWTRLTRNKERLGDEYLIPGVVYYDPDTGEKLQKFNKYEDKLKVVMEFPDSADIETIQGAVPGTEGFIRVDYQEQGKENWVETAWLPVDPDKDFTRQVSLSELKPDTKYNIKVSARRTETSGPGEIVEGSFKTAPSPESVASVSFAVSTCQLYYHKDSTQGFKIYPQILKLNPDFFVHTGDIIYYDRLAKTLPLARWHWARMYSFATHREFHKNMASYFIKDDHDTWFNDCWPGQESDFMGEFTFEQGQNIFMEQVGMGDLTYRTYRWGKDLQIWMVEGRDYRSPNPMQDGPEKTIWGKEQKDWFKRTVKASKASYKILLTPTPIVGPDKENKNDNHANEGFTYEGNEIRDFIADQSNMYVVCGDRHWQYISVDERTGVREYSCGPASNQHADGWSNDKVLPEHQYLNVIGGFLLVEVERENDIPSITFSHYSIDGEILNEDRRILQQ